MKYLSELTANCSLKRSAVLVIIFLVCVLIGVVFCPFQERNGKLIYGGRSAVAKDFDENVIDRPIVYYLNGEEVVIITPSGDHSSNALSDRLITSPGLYSIWGNSYNLSREGLYRFVLPGKENIQRIVYRDDLDSFLSSVSWIVSHGNSDNKKSFSVLSAKALHSKIFVTCGAVSKWAQELLSSIQVESRLVGGITIDEWNTYNNGHLLIEVWHKSWKKWVVFDLDNNSFFLPNDSETPLSVIQWSEHVADRKYRIVHIAKDTRVDISDFRGKNGFDYGFFSEGLNADIRTWYARVMQVPFVYDQDERLYRFMDKQWRERVEGYSPNYKYLEKDIFFRKYYSQKK